MKKTMAMVTVFLLLLGLLRPVSAMAEEIGEDALTLESTDAVDEDENAGEEDELTNQNERLLSAAKSQVELGYATQISSAEWAKTPGTDKTDDVWTSLGGGMKLKVEPSDDNNAMTISTTGSSSVAYDAQVGIKTEGEIQKNDEIGFAFYIRNITGTEAANIKLYFRPVATDSQNTINVHGAMGNSFRVADDWTLCYGTGFSPISSKEEVNGSLVFQVALAEQEFEIRDLCIFNLSRGINSVDTGEATQMSFDEAVNAYNESEKAEIISYENFLSDGAYIVKRQDNLNEANFKVSIVDIDNQDFEEALDIQVTENGNNAWSGQVYFNFDSSKEIKAGDTLFFMCKVRGISSVTNKEAGFVTANTRIRPDGATSSNFNFTANISEDADIWQQVYGACTATTAGTSEGTWVFQLSGAIQELQIADLCVINFGKEFSVAEMPVMPKTYAGMEENASWRIEANERIEQIRKQDISVTVVDAKYNPISNVQVDVDQQSHAFGFGTIVNVDSYAGWDETTQAKYREAFEQISHNRAGFENALKHYYITDKERQTLIDEWLDYFEENNKKVRGHVLIYGDDSRFKNVSMGGSVSSWENIALVKEDSEEGKAALNDWISNHINTYVNKYKGRIYNWDVVNENIPAHLNTGAGATFFWSDRLGGYDALVEWFKLAHEADPEAKLTYNDYGLFSSENTANQYFDLCKYLIDNDAPITTLGVQGHISVMAPSSIISTLNRLSELGKEIEITEFTCEEDDEELQAQFTRDFMIAAFSVENVSSITTWGFWEGCMYQPKAAMVDYDFNLRKNGEVWRDMIYNEWWTDETGITDENGIFNTRAFKGEQKLTISYEDVTDEITIDLNDESENIILQYKNGKFVRIDESELQKAIEIKSAESQEKRHNDGEDEKFKNNNIKSERNGFNKKEITISPKGSGFEVKNYLYKKYQIVRSYLDTLPNKILQSINKLWHR